MLDFTSTIRHYPLPMERFGKNPYQENLYRIVFAPSRRSIIYGEWPDGSREARFEPTYSELGDVWVLERWLPASEFAKCSKEHWDATMSILGPYPERGEYDKCHVFAACGPEDANLDKLISWIEEGRKRSFFENRNAIRSDYEKEQTQIRETQTDIIRETFPAYGTAAMVGFGGGRGTKHHPVTHTAHQLGLPTGGGHKVMTVKGPNVDNSATH